MTLAGTLRLFQRTLPPFSPRTLLTHEKYICHLHHHRPVQPIRPSFHPFTPLSIAIYVNDPSRPPLMSSYITYFPRAPDARERDFRCRLHLTSLPVPFLPRSTHTSQLTLFVVL